MKPLVSIIIPTYNRVTTVGRTIDSILKQTFADFEIIIVEDGSTDDTVSLLKQYTDERIRVVFHEVNRGVTAAKNTGLNNIRGEWFTILDSDDEIVPETLETMLKVPLEIDPEVTAVTCNCMDTTTSEFSGKGLDEDQYVGFRKLIIECSGEFWGLTRTSLLMNDRFNEQLGGFESVLWFKINERSKNYYIHKALRIYHTEGDDRLMKNPPSPKKMAKQYAALIKEEHYLDSMKAYMPDTYARNCLGAVIYLVADKQGELAGYYNARLMDVKKYRFFKLVSFIYCHLNSNLARLGLKILRTAKIIN